jgi:hypothetical protein
MKTTLNAELQTLLTQKAWAEKWLATPVDQYPGTLTREKVFAELERVDDALIDHIGLSSVGGKLVACYA